MTNAFEQWPWKGFRDRGYSAFQKGHAKTDNPYRRNVGLAWIDGWQAAQDDLGKLRELQKQEAYESPTLTAAERATLSEKLIAKLADSVPEEKGK